MVAGHKGMEATTVEQLPQSREPLRQRAETLASAVPWMHSIRLFDDLTVKGGKSTEVLEAEAACIFGRVNLADCSVLDVGAWNGYFSFEAKRRGAARVVACDSFTWQHPIFRGRETFSLARECLQLNVEDVEVDATELPANLGKFDVVLFLGVFYHLFDPISVLDQVSAMASRIIIIETHLALANEPVPAMRFWPRSELGNDITNWWSPNAECIYEMLRTFGFSYVLFQKHPYLQQRGFFHGFRDIRDAASGLLIPSPDNISLFDLDSVSGREVVFGSKKGPNEDLQQLRDGLASAQNKNAALRAKVARMKGSASWKLSRPLRGIQRWRS